MTAPVQPGEILAGKYKVERVLGTGGMGVVVAALHIELDERVAIKFLLEEALANEEAVERFAREARAAVKIKSEHVARVSDVGKLENGAPYMVMEYLEGKDLAAVLEVKHMLPVEEAVEYVLQACEAIAEAHALGIVHRDLKPANLFLTSRADGTPAIKVLDFGISKTMMGRTSRPEMSLTKTTAVMGSPFYMSPEQMRSSKNADTRSDIWALGVILQELISGKTVFDAPSMPELCAKVLTADPEPLTQARPGTPVGLEAVVLRCLDKSQDERFQSIGELATALAPFGPPRAAASVERIHRVLEKAGIPISSGKAKPEVAPAAQAEPSVTKLSEGAHDKPAEGSRAAQAATMGAWNTGRQPAVKTSSPRPMILGIASALLLGGAISVVALRNSQSVDTRQAPAGQGDRRTPDAPRPGHDIPAHPPSDPKPRAPSEPGYDGAASGPKPRAPSEPSALPTAPAPSASATASTEPSYDGAASGPKPRAPSEPIVLPVASASVSATASAAAPPAETAKPAVKPSPGPFVPRFVPSPKPTSKPKADLFSEPK